MIKTSGLSKHFGENKAVSNLDLEIEAGEVFGVLGPNGAGKTTTVRMLSALIAPTHGDAWIDGLDVRESAGQVRNRIGILTEAPGHHGRLSAYQNLQLFAELQEIERPDESIQKYLTMLDLWDRRSDRVAEFSKGMKQKLAIARALLHEPKVLFLDEPTSALDPSAAKVVREFIEELSGEGRTIVICTHNLDEANRLCDRVGILRQSLLKVGTTEDLKKGQGGRVVEISLTDYKPKYEEALKELSYIQSIEVEESKISVALDHPDKRNPEVIRCLMKAGADVTWVEQGGQTLEEVYLKLVAEEDES